MDVTRLLEGARSGDRGAVDALVEPSTASFAAWPAPICGVSAAATR